VLHLLLTRGLAVVWAVSLVESLGAPVPAFPVLLLAGSVAAEYRFSAVPLVIASGCGFWIGDLAWYAFGRIQGRRVLGLLCRLSLNPDACVGRAERRFRRGPAMTVAAAKFIPGFSLMVAPLAGILRMPPVQFAAIDGAASIAWSAAAVTAGFVFGRRVLPHVIRTQRAIEMLGAAAVLAFVAIGVAGRPPDIGHPYGHGKAENLGALTEAVEDHVDERAGARMRGRSHGARL